MSIAGISGRIPRAQIPVAIMHVLGREGSTIDAIEAVRGRSYEGDKSQKNYRDRSEWHTRQDLIVSVAKTLKIHPRMWGEDRTSSDFHNAVDQEIAKIRKKGVIVNWSSSRNIGIFRLAQRAARKTKSPEMSIAEAAPQDAGQHVSTEMTEENLRRVFLSILTRGSKNNTYKFTLAKTLLDYCRETPDDGRIHEIPYEYLSSKFLRYYWHQEYKFKMKQDFRTKSVPKAIQAITDVFGRNPPADFNLLDAADVKRAEQKIRKTVFGKARSKTSLVVPKFQNIPVGNYTEKIRVFYDYDDDAQRIRLMPEAFEFLKMNNGLLSRVVLAEWARFLEKINHSLPRLVAKIDQESMTRESLVQYRKMFSTHSDHCFYCRSRLERGSTHVDHFIPWSYIFDDNAWNLVLACQECNCKKSNSLPQEEFRAALIKRNAQYYKQIRKLRISLDQLDTGRGWKPEIIHHYTNCKEYGFNVIHLP